MNGNGSPEIAGLRVKLSGIPQVIIKDNTTEVTIRKIKFFGPTYTPKALTTVPDVNSNGIPELAVLGVDKEGNVIVQRRDASNPQLEMNITFFDSNFRPEGITSMQDIDGNGIPEIAVLAIRKSDGVAQVRIRDAVTRVLLKSINYPRN